MTLEQLQRRYHWLKYRADFIADHDESIALAKQASEVMADISKLLLDQQAET